MLINKIKTNLRKIVECVYVINLFAKALLKGKSHLGFSFSFVVNQSVSSFLLSDVLLNAEERDDKAESRDGSACYHDGLVSVLIDHWSEEDAAD